MKLTELIGLDQLAANQWIIDEIANRWQLKRRPSPIEWQEEEEEEEEEEVSSTCYNRKKKKKKRKCFNRKYSKKKKKKKKKIKERKWWSAEVITFPASTTSWAEWNTPTVCGCTIIAGSSVRGTHWCFAGCFRFLLAVLYCFFFFKSWGFSAWFKSNCLIKASINSTLINNRTYKSNVGHFVTPRSKFPMDSNINWWEIDWFTQRFFFCFVLFTAAAIFIDVWVSRRNWPPKLGSGWTQTDEMAAILLDVSNST